MKKIITFSSFLAIALSLCLALVPQTTLAMTGSGTEGDPYIIYDVTDLQNMSNNLTAYYELANDIDASATSTWNGGAGFGPVGDGSPFTGSFDGAGHTISDLYINRPSESGVGLFGETGSGVVIQDVVLDSFNVTGNRDVGTLAGDFNSGTVSNVIVLNVTVVGDSTGDAGGAFGWCYDSVVSNVTVVGGTVISDSYVGGVVGYAYQDDFDDCYATCNVSAIDDNAGGFVGLSGESAFDNCYATGSVEHTGGTPGYYFGGFVGHDNDSSTFTHCYATGNVTGRTDIGGFGGYLYKSVVTECYATGNVTAQDYGGSLGGFVGQMGGAGASITDCYSRGDIDGSGGLSDYVGGFVGTIGSAPAITNCYSTGGVLGDEYVGGFCGENLGTITASFWDTQTSGQSTSDGGVGRPTVEMKCETLYTNADWDFATVWISCPTGYYDGYPYFQWFGIFCWEDYDFYQVVWFQPNAIIEGTELPNRTGEVDGIITWGANPAGITITMGPLNPYDPYPEYELPDDIVQPPQDMVGPSGNLDWTADLPTTAHPLYPLVNVIADETSITIKLVWILGATFILLVAMLLCYKFMPHQIITAIVGGALSAYWYAMGIYPFWVVFIFVLMAIAIIIAERMPSIG